MLRSLSPVVDSLWRAAAYCLHRRVIVLSLLPVLLLAGLLFGAAYLFWEPALDGLRDLLESWELMAAIQGWLTQMGLPGLKMVLVPFLLLCLATPVAVLLCLLGVAVFMTPAMLRLVAERRFPLLERRHGGSFAASLLGGAVSTLIALLALLVSIPLWLVPPLMLLLPPLIWGWLTYRVMSYDVLAEHASAEERRALIRRHRPSLLAIGVLSGCLGTLPSVVFFSFGSILIIAAPLLIPFIIWLYTQIFAFSALWFAHYALAALAAMRLDIAAAAPVDLPAPTVALPPVAPASLSGDGPAAAPSSL